MRLNLGCCDNLQPNCVNVDIIAPPRPWPADCVFQSTDLSKPWPWPDSTAAEIYAADIIEHLPDKDFTISEIFRVLKAGSRARIIVPTTDGRGAWQDPGHVSYWNRNSFWYYEQGRAERTRFGHEPCFLVISAREDILPGKVVKLDIVLEAVK